ncbi:MAG: cytochrome c oxidase assembly protein, partial [Microvirga sp.]
MRAAAVLLLLVWAGEAQAHAGHVHWSDTSTTWTWNPWVTVPLAVSGSLYMIGTVQLWSRAGIGRGVRIWQALCFASGWLLLVLALVTPLHWLGERLFVAHMIEHEILMTAAAPLLIVGRPVAMVWAFPGRARSRIGGWGQSPW